MRWPTYRSSVPLTLTMWGSTKCRKNKRLSHVDHLDHVLASILIYTLLRMTTIVLLRCLYKCIFKVRQVVQVRQTHDLLAFGVPHLPWCYSHEVGQVVHRIRPFSDRRLPRIAAESPNREIKQQKAVVNRRARTRTRLANRA